MTKFEGNGATYHEAKADLLEQLLRGGPAEYPILKVICGVRVGDTGDFNYGGPCDNDSAALESARESLGASADEELGIRYKVVRAFDLEESVAASQEPEPVHAGPSGCDLSGRSTTTETKLF